MSQACLSCKCFRSDPQVIVSGMFLNAHFAGGRRTNRSCRRRTNRSCSTSKRANRKARQKYRANQALRKPVRPSATKPAAGTDTSISDADSSDEIDLGTRLLQSEDVRILEAESEYQSLRVQTVKKRIQTGKQKKFNEMRAAIRASVKAAREAYILVREAQPDTPDVRDMLQVGTTCVR